MHVSPLTAPYQEHHHLRINFVNDHTFTNQSRPKTLVTKSNFPQKYIRILLAKILNSTNVFNELLLLNNKVYFCLYER